MSNQDVRYSVDEIIGIVNHSSCISVFIEGVDDVIWYRPLEKEFKKDVLLFPVGGRNVLFDLYKRRYEMNTRTIFIADRDMYVFSRLPSQYKDIIFTQGYSIENDLIMGCRSIRSLFSDPEKEYVRTLAKPLSKWFAFCVEEYKKGNGPKLSVHPKCVLGDSLGAKEIRAEYKTEISFCEPSEKLINHIYSHFTLKFRGKNLAQLLSYVLSKRANEDGCKFSDAQILEIASKDMGSAQRKRIIHEVNQLIVK